MYVKSTHVYGVKYSKIAKKFHTKSELFKFITWKK